MVNFLGWHISRNSQQVAQPQYGANGQMLFNSGMRTIRSDYANGFAPINKLVQEAVNRRIYPVGENGREITYNFPHLWNVLMHPNTNMNLRTFLQTALIGYLSNDEVNILIWHGTTPGYTNTNAISALTFLPRGSRYNLLDKTQFRVRGLNNDIATVDESDVLTLRYSLDPASMTAISPGSASHEVAQILDAMNMQLRAYFNNGATPQLVVTIHAKTDMEFQSIKRSFENANRGPARSYGTVYQHVADDGITGNGNPRIEIATVGAQADNLDIVNITNYATQQINNNLSVSSLIFGDTDASSYQNQEVVNDKFNKTVVNTLSQFLEDLIFELNRVTGGAGFTFGFEYQETEFAEKELTQAQTTQAMATAFSSLVNLGVPSDMAARAVGAPQTWLGLAAQKTIAPIPQAVSASAPVKILGDRQSDPKANRGGRLLTAKQRQPDAHQRIKDILTAMAKAHVHRHVGNDVDDADQKYVNELLVELQQIADNGGTTAARQLAQQISGQTVKTGYEISGTPLKALMDRASKVIDNYSSYLDEMIESTSATTLDAATGVETSLSDAQILSRLDDSIASGDIATRIDMMTTAEGKFAFQSGQQDSAQQIQDNTPNVRVVKVWRAAGPHPCKFCTAMDGTEAGISDTFIPDGQITSSDGAVMPLDTDYDTGEAPTAHPNCSCVYEWHVESAADNVPSMSDVLGAM